METNDTHFTTIRADWLRLNDEYDAYIQSFLDQEKSDFSEEEIAKMKSMQDELYALETQVFKIIAERNAAAE